MIINIAGAFRHFKEIQKLYINNLNFFKENNIQVYDGINSKWSGGRVNFYSSEFDIKKLEFYNNKNIGVYLTFSNFFIDTSLEEENIILSILNKNSLNGVIISNEDFRIYLRKHYPNLKLFKSITSFDSLKLSDYDFSDLESKYDFICPRFEWVFNPKFHKLINPSKYEIMMNDTCIENCKLWHKHFEAISKYNIDNVGDPHKIQECWLNFDFNSKHNCFNGMDLNKNEIKKCLELGYKCFKISGRELNDEYYDEILKNLNLLHDK